MSDTTVQANQTSAYHTTTTTIAEALRRVADVFEESPMDLPEIWLSIKVQVTEHDDQTVSNADRIQAVEMLHGFFGDGMPNWNRTEGSTENWGIYSGREVHHLGASYTAYGRTPHPAWIVGRDELDAYEWQAELDRKSAAAQEAADREQTERAIAAYRALDPWHTPENAVNAIRDALGVEPAPVRRLQCMCEQPGTPCPVHPETAADCPNCISGVCDFHNARNIAAGLPGRHLTDRTVIELNGVPVDYDRRAQAASAELGHQLVDEAMAIADPIADDQLAVDTIAAVEHIGAPTVADVIEEFGDRWAKLPASKQHELAKLCVAAGWVANWNAIYRQVHGDLTYTTEDPTIDLTDAVACAEQFAAEHAS